MQLRHSISAIHIFTVALTAFLVLACVSVVDLMLSVQSQRDRYIAIRERAIDTIEPALAQAMWHIDLEAVEQILRGVQTFGFVHAVEVRDPNGKVFAALGPARAPAADWLGRLLFSDIRTSQRRLTVRVPQRRGSEQIELGLVRVHLDTDYAAGRFRSYVIARLAEQALVLILLAVITTAVTHRLLTRPLRRLAQEVGAIDPAKSTVRSLEAPAFHRRNEIGLLVNRFNDLLGRVRESQALREEILRQQYNRQFLVELNERLEHKITERTRELEREKAHAEFASRSKSIFLANMSHELRTPLNGVIGYAEMIKDEVIGPIRPTVYRTYGEHIHSSGQHMLELIEEVLDLSETEFGPVTLEETTFDVQSEIDQAAATLRPQANRRNIKLIAHVPTRRIWLRADVRKVRQMLLNLISNAIKYTPARGHVEVFARVDGDGRVAVAVEDTGQGIDPERLPYVAEPFNAQRDPTRSSQGGLGLGLPLTKRIMEAHGGELVLHSIVGKGTLATLQFPAWRRCAADGEAPEDAQANSATGA